MKETIVTASARADEDGGALHIKWTTLCSLYHIARISILWRKKCKAFRHVYV